MKIIHGNYLIETLDELGRGGFGRVEKVELYNHSKHFCGNYAIKIYSPSDPAFATDYLPRFAREVKYQADCNHENIVQIYMYKIGETPWFLMDLAECDLQKEMDAGSLNDEDKLGIMKSLLRGVAYLHAKNLLHRDIKPKNILKFLTPFGYVYKLSDFGLAKNVDPKKNSDVLTNIATAMGTKEYMAPESAAAGEYSEKSDIYSLGVVFDKLGHSEAKWLGKIIDKCTHHRPVSRYENVNAIYQDLTAVSGSKE
ncbi:serine/threonine-protein kinase [Xanthomonas euroxanthea]|uniref:serine/threonine-protein kinase n=1 Tax=Xanthomonas euroxanthea TaxID=2259622 RepID=UPI0016221F23|nr:serine/threonine-protein kinase [Xanthomonas euroxanthea]